MSVSVSHPSTDTGLAAALHRLIGRSRFGAQARAGRARYRRIVAELRQLSDRDLADIGIRRCDIPRVAREAAGFN